MFLLTFGEFMFKLLVTFQEFGEKNHKEIS